MSDELIPVCPDCGKQQVYPNHPCWLCGRILGPENLVTIEEAKRLGIRGKPGLDDDGFGPEWSWQSRVALFLLTIVSIVVGLGFSIFAAPLAVVYVVIGVPMIFAWREELFPPPKSSEVTTGDFVNAAMYRVAITIGLVGLLLLAACIALLLVCIIAQPQLPHHP